MNMKKYTKMYNKYCWGGGGWALYVRGTHKALTLGGGGQGLGRGFNATTNSRDQLLNAKSWRFLAKFNVKCRLFVPWLNQLFHNSNWNSILSSCLTNQESIGGQIEAEPIYIFYPINIRSTAASWPPLLKKVWHRNQFMCCMRWELSPVVLVMF